MKDKTFKEYFGDIEEGKKHLRALAHHVVKEYFREGDITQDVSIHLNNIITELENISINFLANTGVFHGFCPMEILNEVIEDNKHG